MAPKPKKPAKLESITKEIIRMIEVDDSDGIEEILAPAQAKSTNAVQRILNLRDIGKKKNTLLLWAAEEGSVSVFGSLLDAGADVNEQGYLGRTCLHYCCTIGFPMHVEIIDMLFETDALDPTIVSDDRETPLCTAIKMSNFDIARGLLQRGKKYGFDINHPAKNNNTSLIRAAFDGNMDVANFVLEHEADLERRNINGESALLVAARYNQPDFVELLLGRGADIRAVDKTGRTALMQAALTEEWGMAELLLGFLERSEEAARDKAWLAAHLDFQDHWGYTLLMHCVKVNTPEAYAYVKRLLGTGAVDVWLQDWHQNCALIHACSKLCTQSIETLIKQGCDPHRKNGDDEDALSKLGEDEADNEMRSAVLGWVTRYAADAPKPPPDRDYTYKKPPRCQTTRPPFMGAYGWDINEEDVEEARALPAKRPPKVFEEEDEDDESVVSAHSQVSAKPTNNPASVNL
jgi:ankyrin repeat protein